ncbi:MAG: DUF2167 domain-containing protein [Candidatus Synoicihabitans palmerolidicus]|nr:DUF2167 domain-containing protein [Candidatus Synoicihabitans palmerolidicus]
MSFRRFLSLGLLLSTVLFASAQEPAPSASGEELSPEAAAAFEEAMARMSFTEQLQAAGVNITTGPATVSMGDIGEMDLPAGFHFIGTGSIERFYELTQNMVRSNEVGVIIAPDDWMLFFDFDDIGYVQDDEKDELDAFELMASMTAGQESSNAARRDRGWDEMRIQGWVTQPRLRRGNPQSQMVLQSLVLR